MGSARRKALLVPVLGAALAVSTALATGASADPRLPPCGPPHQMIQIGNCSAPGIPIDLSRAEAPPRDGRLRLEPGESYLVLLGRASMLERRDDALQAVMALEGRSDPRNFTPPNTWNDPGIPENPLNTQDEGPIFDTPMSSTRIAIDSRSIFALGLYVGGQRNPTNTFFEGMAGAGLSLDLNRVQNDFMAGLVGDISLGLGITQVMSNPMGVLSQSVNGWFLSDRVVMRILRMRSGSLGMVFRGQVDQEALGLNAIGWVGLGVDGD